MEAAVFKGKGKMVIEEKDMPEPAAEEVLVKVKATGVCGTDHHIFRGEAPADPPVVPGHELSGIIEKTGPQVNKVETGDRVAVNPNIHCGHCYYCQRGEIHLCSNLEAVGVTRDGGFAEYVVVPETNVHSFSNNISFEEGAMIEPISCCLHGIDISEIQTGANVLILGGGAIGLILAQLSRNSGAARVFISEPEAKRRKIAEDLGFKEVYTPAQIEEKLKREAPEGADLVIEAVGIGATVEQSLKLVRKGGTAVFFGVSPQDLEIPISPFSVYKRELTIKGSNVNPFVTERALNILENQKINVEKLITNQFNLKDLPLILSGEISDTGLKSIIVFDN